MHAAQSVSQPVSQSVSGISRCNNLLIWCSVRIYSVEQFETFSILPIPFWHRRTKLAKKLIAQHGENFTFCSDQTSGRAYGCTNTRTRFGSACKCKVQLRIGCEGGWRKGGKEQRKTRNPKKMRLGRPSAISFLLVSVIANVRMTTYHFSCFHL